MTARLATAAHAPHAFSSRELAIARSVMFASLFDYPLTLAQLRSTLVESAQTPSEILHAYAGSEALRRVVAYEHGFFFPAARPDLPAERRRREARSRSFLHRHRIVLTLVSALPTVRMVALSGSIAHLNLDADGDLDLFIVTRGARVWSTVVAVVLIAKALGCRRTVCANFVLADTRLSLDEPDLFTASQVIHLKPIVGDDVYQRLLAANSFVRQVYPNFHPAMGRSVPMRVPTWPRAIRVALDRLLAVPGWAAEAVCRWAYRAYLRRRTTGWESPQQVRLDRDCVKLHTQSHRRSVLERFDQLVRESLS